MKEWLKKLIAAKKQQMQDLRAKSNASESLEEVRAIGETLQALGAEIADAEKQLAEFEKQDEGKDDNGAEGGEGRAAIEPQGGFNPVATYAMAQGQAQRSEDGDRTNSEEYRMAFMNYVLRGERSAILDEVRDDTNTLTTDAASVIPTVIINRIVEKAESYGMILPLVTQTQYAAGVEIPTGTLKPVASWVAEGAGSDRQKKTTGKISFTHHKLRCEISMSMEVGAMALSAFENKFVENVAEAMTKAKEQAIISGSGTGQPKGILKETPATGQAIVLTSGTALSYGLICEAEGALPQAYEGNAKWCMTKKTFMQFIGITDDQGQPVARVNYGVGGKPERTLLGREVVLCGDYMANYVATPTENTTFAFIFDFSDYVMNSIYDMGVMRKQDWETEDLLTKAVTACDGKVIDVNSLVTLTINKAAG